MFGWYFIWKSLSADNILNLEPVGNLSLQTWLDYMLISSKEREREKLNEKGVIQFG